MNNAQILKELVVYSIKNSTDEELGLVIAAIRASGNAINDVREKAKLTGGHFFVKFSYSIKEEDSHEN